MKKYLGIYGMGALLCGSVVALAAAPRDTSATLSQSRLGLEQVSQLDSRLSAKLAEQQELLRIVERLLQINANQSGALRPSPGTPLSGAPAVAPAPSPRASSSSPAAPAVPAAPWWSSYRLQMVYWSASSAEAVINGKMYRQGQSLDNGVLLESIDAGAVVLAKGPERHTYTLNK